MEINGARHTLQNLCLVQDREKLPTPGLELVPAWGAGLTFSNIHSTQPRCNISTSALHCSYLLILNFFVILHIFETLEGYCC